MYGTNFSRIRRNIAPVLAFIIVGTVGCKNSNSSHNASSSDPILGRDRIPPQNVPVYGNNNKSNDPIMKSATTTGDTHSKADTPYREGPNTTNAALAGLKPTDEIDPLRIDRNPTYGKSTPNIVPVSAVGSGTDPLLDELRNMGGRLYAPAKLSNGQYEFRASMPLGTSGAQRTYTGTGATQHAAIRDAIEQIRADQGK